MILRILNVLFLLIALGFLFQKSSTENFYNWDGIAYTMAVQLDEGKTVSEAHSYTYSTLKAEVGPGLFRTLCCAGDYRQNQYDNPQNLNSMMPMYALKPGYIFLIRSVKNISGLNEYQTMKYISIFSSLGILILFFVVFFWQSGAMQFIWLPLAFLSQILFLAKLMTPDAITALVFLASIIFLVNRRLYISYLLMAVSLTLRPDMIVATGLAGLLPALNKDFRMAALNSVLFLSMYFVISTSISHNGWWSHFYTSLVNTQSNLDTFNPVFDINKYFEILWGNTLWILTDSNYITWFAATFLIMLISITQIKRKNYFWVNAVALTLTMAILIKYIIFPKVDSRVYLAILVPTLYVIMLNFTHNNEKIDA